MSAHQAMFLCQNCRSRHLKCDDKHPACSNCEASGAECVRGFYIRFKHLSQPFAEKETPAKFTWLSDQIWPRTTASGELIFHDETSSITRSYEREFSDDERKLSPVIAASPESLRPPGLPSLPATNVSSSLPLTRSMSSSGTLPSLKRAKHSHPSNPSSTPNGFDILLNADSVIDKPQYTSAVHDERDGLSWSPTDEMHHRERMELTTADVTRPSAPAAGFATDSPTWPLTAAAEAQLLRYYIDHIAPWFDACDRFRHFATVIPQRASICPPLLQGIFAVAARHLSLSDPRYDPYAADRYHEVCLAHLRRLINDPATFVNENLFAATIILRFLEEIDESESNLQSHMIGVKAVIAAHQRTLNSKMSGLRLACYWIALRQELVISFIQQRPMEWNLSLIPLDYTSCSLTDDDSWANRIIVLCAHVITYSFDADGDKSLARWRELRTHADRWRKNVPAGFEPCWYAPAAGSTEEELPTTGKVSPTVSRRGGTDDARPTSTPSTKNDRARSALPQIWHLLPVHVVAHQHRLLALILLAAHDPSIPRIGPNRRLRLSAVDAEIREYVLDLAGLAWSNSSTPTNMKTASMGIQMAGERLTNRHEQEAVYAVLTRTEDECRWPTTKAREDLRRAWSWSS